MDRAPVTVKNEADQTVVPAIEAAPSAVPAVSSAEFLWGLAAVLIACTLYHLLWWNRYLSPFVGIELFMDTEFAHGRLPYRDYYSGLQPGYVFFPLFITSLFGKRLIVFWVLGVVSKILAMLCLYHWLARVCRPGSAALAVITTCIVSSGDISDFPAWYNYQTIILAVFGGYLASQCMQARGGRIYWLWASLTGFMLSANFLLKQTTGILAGAVIFVGLAIAIARMYGLRRALATMAVVLGTAAIPCLYALYWLIQHDILRAYIDQVFITGPSSKGSLVQIFLRPIVMTWQYVDLRCAAAIACGAVIAFFSLRFLARRKNADENSSAVWRVWLFLFASLLMVWLGQFLAKPGFDISRSPMLASAYLSLLGSLVISIGALALVVRGKADLALLHKAMLAGVSFAAAYAMSMSWPVFEAMAFPGLALMIALALDAPSADRERDWTGAMVKIVCLALIVLASWRKHASPNTFYFWEEPPIAEATTTSTLPELAGFRLSPATAQFYDEVTRLIRAHSTPEDTVLVYPHMPIFYGLADRKPAGFCPCYLMDVCPDSVAARDAQFIREHPPAVIVNFQIPPDVYDDLERIFRNGNRSGQRQLVEVIDDLVKNYHRVGDFHDPSGKTRIEVWARTPIKN